jgi:2'-5' RNA ligase
MYKKCELKELEHLRNIKESQAFYQKLNKSQKDFQPRTTLGKDESRILSGDSRKMGRVL